MGWLPQTALILALLAVVGASAGAVEPAPPGLTVRVYDFAEVPGPVWKRAEEVATAVFQEAGIEITWLLCPATGHHRNPDPGCRAPMGPLDLTLRALPSAPRELSRRPQVLGTAHVPVGGGFAHYADIYFDRIEDLAHKMRLTTAGGIYDTRIPATCLRCLALGMVAAHELGHLILGSNSHARVGLMRRGWGRQELQAASHGRLGFHVRQVKRLHQRLRVRLLSSPGREPVVRASR